VFLVAACRHEEHHLMARSAWPSVVKCGAMNAHRLLPRPARPGRRNGPAPATSSSGDVDVRTGSGFVAVDRVVERPRVEPEVEEVAGRVEHHLALKLVDERSLAGHRRGEGRAAQHVIEVGGQVRALLGGQRSMAISPS
jgi:hypothetical protein